MKNLLNFVVVGVQKSATTWLYDCLNQHPELNLRNSKNEEYYYGSTFYNSNGKDKWYFSQFSQDMGLKGCVSVEYIEDLSVFNTLYKLNPNIKIIVSLRRPDLRLISAYQWYVRKSLIPDLPLNEGLSNMLNIYFNSEVSDFSKNYLNLIERGFYLDKIKYIYNIFPQDQVKIVLFDEINEDRTKVIQEIFSFLNVNSNFIPSKIDTIPKKNTGNRFLIKFQRFFPKSTVFGKIVDLSNQLLFKNNVKSNNDKLDYELKLRIESIYFDSNKEFKNFIQKFDSKLASKLNYYWEI